MQYRKKPLIIFTFLDRTSPKKKIYLFYFVVIVVIGLQNDV